MPSISHEQRDDLRRLSIWILLSLVVEFAPLSVHLTAHLFSGHEGNWRDVVGYSTSLTLAFAILLIAVCEVVVEGFWRLASDFSAALTLILLIVICHLSGWAITLDSEVRLHGHELPVEPARWIWFEACAVLTLLMWGSLIRVWMMGKHRAKIVDELKHEHESKH
jgi:cation transport ATPase